MLLRRNGFQRRASAFGVLNRAHRKTSPQDLIDQFGFAYIENAIDVVAEHEKIAELHQLTQELIAELKPLVEEVGGQVSFVYRLASITFKFNRGVTQIFIDRDLPLQSDYMERFLSLCDTLENGAPLRVLEDVGYPQVRLLNEKGADIKFSNRPSTSAAHSCPLSVHERVANLFKLVAEIASPVVSKKCEAMVLVAYDPETDLAMSESKTHHFDLNRDVATRSIGLVGDIEGTLGIDDDHCLKIRRKAGDESLLNYMRDGFGARYPFHDYRNVSESPALSLVIDEPGEAGYALMKSLGLLPSRAIPQIIAR